MIHHTNCGLQTTTEDELKAAVEADTGIRPAWAVESFTDPYPERAPEHEPAAPQPVRADQGLHPRLRLRGRRPGSWSRSSPTRAMSASPTDADRPQALRPGRVDRATATSPGRRSRRRPSTHRVPLCTCSWKSRTGAPGDSVEPTGDPVWLEFRSEPIRSRISCSSSTGSPITPYDSVDPVHAEPDDESTARNPRRRSSTRRTSSDESSTTHSLPRARATPRPQWLTTASRINDAAALAPWAVRWTRRPRAGPSVPAMWDVPVEQGDETTGGLMAADRSRPVVAAIRPVVGRRHVVDVGAVNVSQVM